MKNIEQTGIFFYNPPELIQEPLDYTELATYALGYKNVVKIWSYDEFPWTEGNILKKIGLHHLERLIIAGSLPGSMKTLFSKAMAISGKDPQDVILASFNARSEER